MRIDARSFGLGSLAVLLLASGLPATGRPAAACASSPPRAAATSIHILGSFNGWDEALWQTDPGMSSVTAVTWIDTIDISPWWVEQDYQEFKFVTDRAWDESPDYVLCPDRLDEYTLLSGPVCMVPSGLNLLLFADVPGRYEMNLDTETLVFSARLVEPFAARITGTLEFGSRAAPGTARATKPSLDHAGARRFPRAEVRAFAAGKSLLLARGWSSEADGTFWVDSLPSGTYDLAVRASGYLEAMLRGVAVAGGDSTDVGTVHLVRGCTSRWNAIQVVGDFNSWNTGTPSMSQISACVWEDTLAVLQGCHYMKFRTGGEWGQDYGTCTAQDPDCQVPLAGNVCLVEGENALGKLNFAVMGGYVFRLDEEAGTYEIRPIETPVHPISWTNLKARYR